jgi:hypothetical protein
VAFDVARFHVSANSPAGTSVFVKRETFPQAVRLHDNRGQAGKQPLAG